ncbi:hypothetical protein GP486_006296 [Trichoglossum hirsutum]|uniref:NACHT domain-containing protein n=1 Tax=Trichoglossum hirsutum TaxID=265104 RepID=A0A9P8IHH2_9PEZI|nr:hypothetical protein GP486_006296 [Trichoglossum hirsutum]
MAHVHKRPLSTEKLVERLGDPKLMETERKALQALSKSMIGVFKDDRKSSYMLEIVELSSVVASGDYGSLVEAVANAIINGTSDSNILGPTLLKDFVYVLRRAEGVQWAKTALGPVMASLQQRLKSAVGQAQPESQYQLICTLSAIIDRMIDIKTGGLSREVLHEPLLMQLKSLSDHQELRLAQAACYAHQALLGVPDDEGPYQKLWRHMCTIGGDALKAAGVVSGRDPAKLLDAISALKEMPNLIKSMIGVIKDIESMARGMKPQPKQKDWYFALRYTDMLIQAKAVDKLKELIPDIPCRKKKKFLCGLYAQLEQAWGNGDSDMKDRIVRVLEQAVIPIGSTHRRVQEWDALVADTLGLEKTFQSTSRSRILSKKKEYNSDIEIFLRRRLIPGTLPKLLFEEAWSRCEEAQVFYADAGVRKYYTEGNRLKIERLSGKELDMGSCYINLAVVEHLSGGDVEHSEEGNTKRRSNKFSLFDRLKVETPNRNFQVSLPALFDLRDGRTARPKRILIQGCAGVGKTTLCKKIVYDYIHDGMWASLFNRLLWVPLRKLKRSSGSAYNLEDLFYDEYFSPYGEREGKLLANALFKTVCNPDPDSNPTSYGRTLFVLDGLDEVSREINSETHVAKFLRGILNQQNVIITSRPYGMRLDNLDLELETIGFYPDQVNDYLWKVIPEKANEVQEFIQGHMLIQGLVRIPIQLDAICYTWDESFRSQGTPKSMTTLYQYIVLKLWKKDIPRLEGRLNRKPLENYDVQNRYDTQIKEYVRDESNHLGLLAFTGMCNNTVGFEKVHRSEICKEFEKIGSPVYENELKSLSFLRTSDHTLDDSKQVYHFLHLTFQEFFAAQYFARHWIKSGELLCLEFDNDTTKPKVLKMTARDFFKKEKYNGRYDILWRFVAGLLHAHRDEKPPDRLLLPEDEPLNRFFQTLEDEPRDLLGPAHQRIVMHCLSEVPDRELSLDGLRNPMENRLLDWVSFGCDLSENVNLTLQREFPDHLLITLLKNGEEGMKKAVLRSLELRPSVPSEVFEVLGLLLKDRDPSMRFRVVFALGSQSALPKEILEALVPLLRDGDQAVRLFAARALGNQSTLPKETLEVLVSLLKGGDQNVRLSATDALGYQFASPKEILEVVVPLLKDGDPDVRSSTANILRYRSALPKEVLGVLVSLLKDGHPDVRSSAVDILKYQSALPKEILEALVLLLKDGDHNVRPSAARALGNQSALPREILEALSLLLKDGDQNVRSSTAGALGSRPTLPKEILEVLNSLLEDDNPGVRLSAAGALGNQLALPREILEALISQLKDGDRNIRSSAAHALGKQSALPREILEALSSLLKNGDRNIRPSTVHALRNQSALPKEILEALSLSLMDEDVCVRLSAADALKHQSALPTEILEALIPLLKDNTWGVGPSVAGAIYRRPDFYRYLPSMDVQCLNALFSFWIRKSFEEQISCYLQDDTLYIYTVEGLRKVPLTPNQQMTLMDVVRKVRQDLHVPS